MGKNFNLQSFSLIISSLFFAKKTLLNNKKHIQKSYTYSNLFFVTHVLHYLDKSTASKTPSLLNKKIQKSGIQDLNKTTHCTQSLYSKQDPCFLASTAFFTQNLLIMKKVAEWKLSKYIKDSKKLHAFIEQISTLSQKSCKTHLINLLKEEEKDFSPDKLEEELKRQEKNWQLYQTHGNNNSNTISPI